MDRVRSTATLNRMLLEDFEKVNLNKGEKEFVMSICRWRGFQGPGMVSTKMLSCECAWHILGTARNKGSKKRV